MRALPLPVGTLSEEAQERRNKDVRDCREFHARKTSRVDTLKDQLHHLLVCSDPVIANIIRTDIRRPRRRTRKRRDGESRLDLSELLQSPRPRLSTQPSDEGEEATEDSYETEDNDEDEMEDDGDDVESDGL